MHATSMQRKQVTHRKHMCAGWISTPPGAPIKSLKTLIVSTEADAQWVHHPRTDAFVITVRMANKNIHIMLVDNGSAVDILYWDAYKRTGLIENDLLPMTSPLYGFTGGHVIPRGTIKLAVTVGEHPKVMTEFLTIDCPSAFKRLKGRPLLKALRAVTSIYCLKMKFPMVIETGQVRGR